MKLLLICLVLIVGNNCWPLTKDVDESELISNSKSSDVVKNDLSTSNESLSQEDDDDDDDDNDDGDDYVIKLPNLGPNAYKEPNKANAMTVNPGEYGEFAEGDMRLPSTRGRAGMRSLTYRWRDAVVPIKYERYQWGNWDGSEWKMFGQALKSIEANTCVRFKDYDGETDYLYVTHSSEGCFSAVGRVGGEQQLNLQRDGCLYDVGTPAHELMHALGIIHEQSRPDRDNYVTINYQNIVWERRNNFQMSKSTEVNTFDLPYQYDSVMHYDGHAFSSNGRATIVPKPNRGWRGEMGQRRGPTAIDYKKINIMYNCEK